MQDQIRFFGLLLQLLGVGTVAHGLRETRKLFGQPSLQEQFVEWWQWRPRWSPYPIAIASGEPSRVQVTGGTVHFEEGVKPDTSVEGRLTALEEKYEALQKQLVEAQDKIRTGVAQLDATIQDEQREREIGDRENADLLKELSTGGLSIEWMGLVWLFVGIVCATVPEEIAGLLS